MAGTRQQRDPYVWEALVLASDAAAFVTGAVLPVDGCCCAM